MLSSRQISPGGKSQYRIKLALTFAVASPALCVLLYQIYCPAALSGCSSSPGTGTGQLWGGFTRILPLGLNKRHPHCGAAPLLPSSLAEVTTLLLTRIIRLTHLFNACFNNERLLTGAVKSKQKCIEDIVSCLNTCENRGFFH